MIIIFYGTIKDSQGHSNGAGSIVAQSAYTDLTQLVHIVHRT